MLRDDINKALTEAMKAKNERTVSTLAHGQFDARKTPTSRRAAAASRRSAMPRSLSILQKMIKQRQESVELYKKGNRPSW